MEEDVNNKSRSRYWVLPGRLLAGPYPVSSGETLKQEMIELFEQNGISQFVDLTQDNETSPLYADVIHGLAAGRSSAVKHIRFSIPDMDVPSWARMKKILDYIDSSLAQGESLYLHCMGGLGRTGTVVGCFLVRHGLSGEEALHRLAYLRRDSDSHWKKSPETEAQRQFILHWSE